MLKIDLHTHSVASPDGALKIKDYAAALEHAKLDYIAITDHDHIAFALEAQKILGDRIIVGEEITTSEGEIIGLYISKLVPSGRSAQETVQDIKKQGGLVYIPHPFETVRKGIPLDVLNKIRNEVDIIEIHNGRAVFQDKGHQAAAWAEKYQIAAASSSDAHGRFGWTKTYTRIHTVPTPHNLTQTSLSSEYVNRKVGFGILYPKFNRFKKWLRKKW